MWAFELIVGLSALLFLLNRFIHPLVLIHFTFYHPLDLIHVSKVVNHILLGVQQHIFLLSQHMFHVLD